MTRSEIRQKFSFIGEKLPGNPKVDDCFANNLLSIDNQIKNLKIGKNIIFYFIVKSVTEGGGVNLELTSETVYLSPPKYL
jgi:hypothetical protein